MIIDEIKEGNYGGIDSLYKPIHSTQSLQSHPTLSHVVSHVTPYTPHYPTLSHIIPHTPHYRHYLTIFHIPTLSHALGLLILTETAPASNLRAKLCPLPPSQPTSTTI